MPERGGITEVYRKTDKSSPPAIAGAVATAPEIARLPRQVMSKPRRGLIEPAWASYFKSGQLPPYYSERGRRTIFHPVFPSP